MSRKGSEFSNSDRKIVIQLYKDGKSLRQIAKIMHRSHSTIQSVVKIYNSSGRIEKKKRNGNRLILSRRHQSFVRRVVRQDNTISAVKLAGLLQNQFQIKITPQSVRNYLRRFGIQSRTPASKPFINNVNRRKRLNFAKRYLNKDFRYWKRVIFSDECKINLKLSDGRVRIWREKNTRLYPKNMLPTFKHGGGSLMIWGCFAASGVGNLHFIDGIMNAKQYVQILKTNLHQSAQNLGIRRKYIFQQDNDPKHTALHTRLWLLYNCRKCLNTPPQSPGVNPIENLWSIFKKNLKNYSIRNKEDLKTALQTEWQNISPNLTQKLVQSMPNRLRAIIKQKGFPTKY